MADGHQPVRRGDDDFRGGVRGDVSGHSRRAASWFAYWLFPIPNQMAMWPNFFSPLLWDVFAVSTYATVSVLFWYMGMVPDLATFRDRATTKMAVFALRACCRWDGGDRTGTGMCMSGRI